MSKPELMSLDSADGNESYIAYVTVLPEAVVFDLGFFDLGFKFRFDRASVRQVCERLLELLGPAPEVMR